MKNNQMYIDHILEETIFLLCLLEHIEWEDFEDSRILQGTCKNSITIIGEAAKRIDKEVKEAHPEIDWGKLNYMQNLFEHGYFKVDLQMFWNTQLKYVPKLYEQFYALRKSFSTEKKEK
ncbi:MAG TPA: DUF86 domain-containing protein [Methanocorpusculum sp.]|nr:DUF86 domain-containing protein [Methanocorpusculum sp.]